MSQKPDKTAKHKDKLKVRKFHTELHRLHQNGRIVDVLRPLCADILPKYVDGPNGIDHNIIGMVAWNIAVTGYREINASSVNTMKLDEEYRKMVWNEAYTLVRHKYEKFPEHRIMITNESAILVAGKIRQKVFLAGIFRVMPIPKFYDKPEPITLEQIQATREGLGQTQAKVCHCARRADQDSLRMRTRQSRAS